MPADPDPFESCYACDARATTREHVPPRGVFPKWKDSLGKDLRRALITVPSCAQHNTDKSPDDEYFLQVLATDIRANESAWIQAGGTIARAIRRAPSLADQLLAGSKDVVVYDSKNGNPHEAAVVPLDADRFFRVLDLVFLGIYRHHFQHSWTGSKPVVFSENVTDEEPSVETERARVAVSRDLAKLFHGTTKHGANQEVFFYQVRSEDAAHAIRAVFYGRCPSTAMFGAEAPETTD
jgi:hypothetical protein